MGSVDLNHRDPLNSIGYLPSNKPMFSSLHHQWFNNAPLAYKYSRGNSRYQHRRRLRRPPRRTARVLLTGAPLIYIAFTDPEL